MYLVVTYDIANNKRRYRIDKTLKGYGERVQKSVFECRLTESQNLELRERLRPLMNLKEDHIRYYELCSRCQGAIACVGVAPVTEEVPYVLL